MVASIAEKVRLLTERGARLRALSTRATVTDTFTHTARHALTPDPPEPPAVTGAL